MNEKKLNVRQALRVFHTITTHGQHDGDEYRLNGITASTDFDGYTASLYNDYVRVDIFFHNTFSMEASSAREKIAFLEKLDAIDKADYDSRQN